MTRSTLLDSDSLTVEVRLWELTGEIISDEGAATVASYWYSASAPQLMILATHTNPFADERFDLDKLESEVRLEHRLMETSGHYASRERARYTRDFEAVYAWIQSKRDTGVIDLTEQAAFFGYSNEESLRYNEGR